MPVLRERPALLRNLVPSLEPCVRALQQRMPGESVCGCVWPMYVLLTTHASPAAVLRTDRKVKVEVMLSVEFGARVDGRVERDRCGQPGSYAAAVECLCDPREQEASLLI
jgi:hypothetical protein